MILGGSNTWTNNSVTSGTTLLVSGTVTMGANNLTFAGTGGSTISGPINGTGKLGVVGGVVTLDGTNIYTGATNVRGGTLIVGDSTHNTASIAIGSAVTVNGSGTLGGSGTVKGSVTINSGGTLSPGNSPGTLNTGTTTYGSGGNYLWQVNNATGTKGGDPGYDFNNVDRAPYDRLHQRQHFQHQCPGSEHQRRLRRRLELEPDRLQPIYPGYRFRWCVHLCVEQVRREHQRLHEQQLDRQRCLLRPEERQQPPAGL